MTIKKLFEMKKKYNSITVYEQEDRTFIADCFFWDGKNRRRTLKFAAIEDYKDYLNRFKVESMFTDKLYACLKENESDKFYINIYLKLKHHIC